MVQCLDLQDLVPIGGHNGCRAGAWYQETFKGSSVEDWREPVFMENPDHNRCHGILQSVIHLTHLEKWIQEVTGGQMEDR